MQNWTPDMWQAAGIGLIIGLIIGYFFIRFTKGSVKKQTQTESELKQVKAQVETQKSELEKHFAESADLLKTLAQDYQKLYKHLAATSTTLLPELANKPLFNQNLITDNTHNSAEPANVPVKDYSEGSSGILKAEK
ncbi:hypothetical protein EDC44_11513 [Cricetibacter osteomyelitidis]|uniref:Z-ring associated protein G n=1 Tax=Cricetibacter osteomyelitidis TaxID=1521931 RepID=A0A4R2SYF4_9PAST|nr:DUF1043 family protein [Cricetibacter osteomyelitidis]TCP94710.1 hypothetical protein EDC44_11513 [Cricetibacter osteomyelitidis]